MESASFSGHGVLMVLQNILKSRGKFSPRTIYCRANWNLTIFEPGGFIYPCYHALGDIDLAVGNINNKTSILDETKLEPWRERTVDIIEECKNCPAKYICSGGCAYEALTTKGSLLKPSCQPYEPIIKWAFESLHEDFMESERYNQVHQEYAAAGGE
jgi:radical SAM protein with 4Fe4S-binding SPASM domain